MQEFLSNLCQTKQPSMVHPLNTISSSGLPYPVMPKTPSMHIYSKDLLQHPLSSVQSQDCQLTRNNILNFLDVCLLQTDWRNLNILPHSFCQGQSFTWHVQRHVDVASVKHAGHWNLSNKAFEAYTLPWPHSNTSETDMAINSIPEAQLVCWQIALPINLHCGNAQHLQWPSPC